MKETFRKIISVIRYIVAIGLVVFGIGIAVYQIQKNYDFFGRIKIYGVYIAVFFVATLFLCITRDKRKDKGGTFNNISIDNNPDAQMALTSAKLSTWLYVITIAVYSIIKVWNESAGIIAKIFMVAFVVLIQVLPVVLIATIIASFMLTDTSGDPSTKPKSRKIRATTFNWSENWSTTTYRDEDGNETKIDHWKF